MKKQEYHLLPLRKIIVIGSMLVLLLGGLIISVGVVISDMSYPIRTTDLFNVASISGVSTADWEQTYNEKFPLRPLAVRAMTLAKYRLFGEGNKGVLISGSWMFSSEEFEAESSESEVFQKNVEFVERVFQKLSNVGISLVVVVVPAKARIYNDKLGRYRWPAIAVARYSRIEEALIARGIFSVNLVNPLQSGRESADVFFKTDTHWTPSGAMAAAEAIATNIPQTLKLPPMRIEWHESESVLYEGDLMRYLPLGSFKVNLGFPKEEVSQIISAAHSQNLFGDSAIDVALVGTSYSANVLFSFESSLRIAMSTDILNVARAGVGPFKPMEEYLESDSYKHSRPQLVIWEIPERLFDKSSYEQ